MENICCGSSTQIDKETITMSMLEPGSKGVIKSFIMNCEDNEACHFVRRLKEVGLHVGARFEVLKNAGNGEIFVCCEGAALALGRGMADKIYVEISDGELMEGSVFGRICRRFGIKCRP